MKKKLHPFLCTLALITLFSACKPDDDDPPGNYDRPALLSNTARNIILPAYAKLQRSVDTLSGLLPAFIANPDTQQLSGLRASLKKAWLDWQGAAAFEFGPAGDRGLSAALNTFPTDTLQIETNIDAGTWDLALAANADAKGFPALDYLLYGYGNDANTTLSRFSTAPDAAGRLSFLNDLVSEIKTLTEGVVSGWEATGGNFLATFTGNAATDVGSPTGLLVNQFNADYEILKSAEIGIPLGKKTLGVPIPEKTQAFYGGFSAELARAHLNALEGLYLGLSLTGSNGYGFDDILRDLATPYNNGLLADAISEQFGLAKNALAAVPDPLSQTILNNPAPVEATYTELQKLVVLIKSDMPSAMGILITYQDNDGD